MVEYYIMMCISLNILKIIEHYGALYQNLKLIQRKEYEMVINVSCDECNYWSVDFMLGYVNYLTSLVSQGKTKSPTSSSSPS